MTLVAFDVIVIGAGVIGLAVARAFAIEGRSVLILEKANAIGTETSARNSEVIHAGIYYPAGSLKGRACVDGRERLYRFCEANGVPHRRCGKLILAVEPDERPALEALQASAASCGVDTLRLLDSGEVRQMEPDLRCSAALYSPDTGILDSHAYMLALLGAAENDGAELVRNTEVTRVTRQADGWAIEVAGADGAAVWAPVVVNAAGLEAAKLAGAIEGFPGAHVPRLRFAKGCYFSYSGRTSFRHLVYPMPEAGGLGVHLTLDMAGRIRFGPDVEWVERPDYHVPADRRAQFARTIRRYWPDVEETRLEPDYAGVRPKLTGPGEPAADFLISGPEDHGQPGITNLFGIESPGITASLALADEVVLRAALAD